MKKLWRLGLQILIVILGMCACSNPEATLVLDDDSRVVVRVNGKTMTRNQMHNEVINLLLAIGQDFPAEVLAQKSAEFYAQAIQNLINTELLVEEAIRRGFRVEQWEIDARLGELRGAYDSQEQLRDELSVRDLTDRELAEEARRGLYVEKIIAQEIELAPLPDSDQIQSYYDQNHDLLSIPEQIHVAHLVIEVLGNDPDQVRAAKLAEAERLRRMILDGADFGQMASTYSDCPSKQENGDLGWITRDRMRPEFTEAAFGLSPGTISEIVETADGFHIIKVFEHRLKTLPERDTVEEYIVQRLVEEEIRDRIQHLVALLQRQASIDIESEW